MQYNILVACEHSGRVRDAFIANGHKAVSCDLLPSDSPAGPHIQGDVRELLKKQWDMVIAFPPCTYLAASGACWWKMRQIEQQEAIKFFMLFTNLHHIPKVCIENPVGIMSRMYRKPDQIINPYHFGHVEKKRTCLWLKGLAPLMYTNIVPKEERVSFVNHVKKGPDRAKNRSLTFEGVARAMGEQWS